MAIQHDEQSVGNVVPSQAGRPARSGSRPGPRVVGGAVGAVALAGAVAAWSLGAFEHTPSTVTTAPVTVPDKVGGLAPAPAAQDFSKQGAWQTEAEAAVGGATVVGRQYGSPKQRKTIRVVAARTDLSKKLEMRWVADKGTKVGKARCTQNFVLTEDGSPRVRPTMLLCWRTTKTFSAYSIVIDFDRKPSEKEAVQAIDDIWGKA